MPSGQYKNLKSQLDKTFADMQKKKFANEDNADLIKAIGKDIIESVAPALAEHNKQFQESTQQIIKDVLKEIKVELPKIDSPQFDNDGLRETIAEAIAGAFSGVRIPEPKVSVNVPEVRMPDIHLPQDPRDIKGFVQLMGVDIDHPLPVQIRDKDGKPVNLLEGLTRAMAGGGGGGKADYFTIRGILASAWGSLLTGDGRLKTESASGSSGLTDTELRAAHLDVLQVSGATESVNLQMVNGSSVVTGTGYSDNALRVIAATDANTSVNLMAINNNYVVVGGGYSDNALRVVHATDAVSSVRITDASGNFVAVDSFGNMSTLTSGNVGHDAADSGNPVKIGGQARTTNPTAVANANRVNATFDDLGRQLIRPIQVRDLIQTAYAQLTTGTETTLIAGVASTFLDLIYIAGANNSDVAVSVDLRSGTGGSVLLTLQIPASGTAGVALPVPIPQEIVAGAWTADMGDITGTTVSLSALFSKEV